MVDGQWNIQELAIYIFFYIGFDIQRAEPELPSMGQHTQAESWSSNAA